MINLAGYRYRGVFADRQGPIERIETSDFTVENRRMFLANAYMRRELLPLKRRNSVYSDATGSGTHESPMIARYMAISESMERWAYHDKVKSDERCDYGFDVDPMSNGMAAFPGLFPGQARRKAYLEAVERFSLIAWWEGMLPGVECASEWPGIGAAILWAGPGEVVVVLHKKTKDGLYAYGHAAGSNFKNACRSAVMELARHEYVIKSYWLAKVCGCAVVDAPNERLDRLERRSVFFASEEGHEEFLRRLRTKPAVAPAVRRLAFDGRIPGPWERFAHVWRVVFYPVTDRYLSDDERYFLW